MSGAPTMIDWTWRSFAELTLAELYEILGSRQDVFILEQTCFYQDVDGFDQDAHHLLGWHMVDGADTRAWIAPRIPVRLTSRDWFANRDPVLDAVLQVVRNE